MQMCLCEYHCMYFIINVHGWKLIFLFFLRFVYLFTVPDDVFAPNYIWKGSYNYKGRKQPMTLSITSFNKTTGRVNVTLTSSNMELLLSGWFTVTFCRFTQLTEHIIIHAANQSKQTWGHYHRIWLNPESN